MSIDSTVLRRVCDILVPRVPAAPGDSLEAATLLGLSASDTGIDAIAAAVIPMLAPHVQEKIAITLAGLGEAEGDELAGRWRAALDNPCAFRHGCAPGGGGAMYGFMVPKS